MAPSDLVLSPSNLKQVLFPLFIFDMVYKFSMILSFYLLRALERSLKFVRGHLGDMKKYIPEFIPEFVPVFVTEFDLNSDLYSGTNSGINSGTYFFRVI